jgi:hypothetical protein
MLLWSGKNDLGAGNGSRQPGKGKRVEDLAGDIALQAADDLSGQVGMLRSGSVDRPGMGASSAGSYEVTPPGRSRASDATHRADGSTQKTATNA